MSEPRTQRSGVSGQPLTPLRCIAISLKSSWQSRILSGLGKPLYVGLVGGQQGRRDPLARRAKLIAVRLLDLDDQAVRFQHPQFAGNRGGLPALLLGIGSRSIQQLA